MVISFVQWVEIVSVAGTVLVGGMRLGAMDNKIDALAQRKDQSEDVASVKAQVNDMKADMSDMKTDIRDIKRLLLGQVRR